MTERTLPVVESEASFASGQGASVWRDEPFRLFFPLAVLLGWVGVGHWVLYTTGLRDSFSCLGHGLVQMQAFMMAFALGFLLTALPRRTRSAAPTTGELAAFVTTLVVSAVGAELRVWWLAEAAYATTFVLLLRFALRRFLVAGGRRPPAAFVMIPLGILHGLGGAALITAAGAGVGPDAAITLGTRMVEQGVFLCFVVGIGGLFLPLLSGTPPPPDLGSSPAETRTALAYAAAGLAIFASLVLEAAGWTRLGPLARAVVFAAAVAPVAAHPPGKPGFHRRLVRIAVWMMPLGLAASAVFPDYRVAALHVLFIGGFGLMAFSVATHVSLGHLGLQELAAGRPVAIVVMAVAFAIAMVGRVTADWSATYFEHVGWSAAAWLVGATVWLAFLGPRLLRRP